MALKYCERCRWRTKHVRGVCQDCATPTPPEPPTPGGTIDMFTEPEYRTCPTCPPGDNEWPPQEFGPGGRCYACIAEGRSRRKPCTGCGAKVRTLAHVARPLCQKCRRALHPRKVIPIGLKSLRGIWRRQLEDRKAA
jgi:hypothetical protein